MCTTALPMESNDRVSDGFADLLNYDALGLFHDISCPQQEIQDFDSLFQAGPESPFHFSALSDLVLDNTSLDELGALSQYPGELDLQYDLQPDPTVDFNFPAAGSPPKHDGWIESQHNPGLYVHQGDETAYSSLKAENVAIELRSSTTLPNETISGMEAKIGNTLISSAPSREDAMCAIAVISQFLYSQPAGPLQLPEATIIQGMVEELRSSKKRRRGSETSLELKHKPKEGRVGISSVTKELLERSFFTNPYIKNDALESLAVETGLPSRSIRTWFANARSRKVGPICEYQCNRLQLKPLERMNQLTSEATPQDMHEIASKSSQALRLNDQLSTCSPTLYTSPTRPNDWSCESVADEAIPIPHSAYRPLEGLGTNENVASPVSEANIRQVNRDSSNYSSVSIKRYLEAIWEETHLTSVAHSTRRDALLRIADLLPSSLRPGRSAMEPERPSSVVGSDSSMNSGASNTSCISYRSVDPRGLRRGRKVWTVPRHQSKSDKWPPMLPPEAYRIERVTPLGQLFYSSENLSMPIATTPTTPSFLSHERLPYGSKVAVTTTSTLEEHPEAGTRQERSRKPSASAKQPYFCTWHDCEETFRHRFEWARHEEAKHYCPYYWVCCLNSHTTSSPALSSCFLCGEEAVTLKHVMNHAQFQRCSSKDAASRSFSRKDHLTQHIKGTHLAPHERAQVTPSVLSKILTAWKTDNPAMSKAALFCGFCGITMESWADRQGHVAGHFQPHSSGYPVCKSSWQLDRESDARS
jgi:hypothetical protein